MLDNLFAEIRRCSNILDYQNQKYDEYDQFEKLLQDLQKKTCGEITKIIDNLISDFLQKNCKMIREDDGYYYLDDDSEKAKEFIKYDIINDIDNFVRDYDLIHFDTDEYKILHKVFKEIILDFVKNY